MHKMKRIFYLVLNVYKIFITYQVYQKLMNQIQLFNKEGQQQGTPVPDRLGNKRPQKLQVSKTISQNQKWKQCKIIGKNISIRSYSGACAFKNKMYIYGGYQILNGLMSDFYQIDLDDNIQKFTWVELCAKQGNLPGPRAKHCLVGTKDKIYLIAGLYSDVKSSNQIFQYDPEAKKWTQLKPVGDSLPCLDSFGYALTQRDGDDVIILVGGYNCDKQAYSNAVFQYNIPKNKISILFEGTQQLTQKYPVPRSGCSATSNGSSIYMFGGKNYDTRMNDLWLYDLNTQKFTKMPAEGYPPVLRNGHTINYHENKLYVFGGIHDITWQLDDLHIYDLTKKQWTTLQQDSARKVDKKKKNLQEKKQKSPDNKNNSKKKNWYDTANSLYGNKSINSPMNKNYSSAYKQDEKGSMSPGKMIDQQRKKLFYQKKAEMLKTFDINENEKNRYIQLQTSSQAMKNSLDVIGNPNPKIKVPQGKITDFGKESISKFLQPLQNNTNLIIGKRPCARDGHCAIILNNQLVIFGGDRHQMSFNDIYKLNLALAKKQAEY